MTEILRIRRATVDDMETIIDDLIDDARAWLPSKDTDQWAMPWPNQAARDARVLRDLKAGRTWLVEDDDDAPVATVTCNDKGNRRLWTPEEQLVSAIYVARLIVRRSRAGERIGEALVSWAGARGVRHWSAEWIRIDVWTTNEALHNYYEKRGFQHYKVREFKEDEYCPSAALFQKPTAEIDRESVARFIEPTGQAAGHKDVILPVGMVPQVPLGSPGRRERPHREDAERPRPARLGDARLLPEGIGFSFRPNARIRDPLRPRQRQ